MLGRFDQARTELEIAMQLDPLSSIIREGLGAINTLSRKYDEAIEVFKQILALDPSFYKAYSFSEEPFFRSTGFARLSKTWNRHSRLREKCPTFWEHWVRLTGFLEITRELAPFIRNWRTRPCAGLCRPPVSR